MASTSNNNQELEKLKQELRDYKTGNKLGLEAFQDAEPGEMKNMKVRMALFGMTGSGKSALVNTVMKILCGKDEKGVAIEQSSGGEGTTILEEFFPQFNFRLIDTRGFFEFHSLEESKFQYCIFTLLIMCLTLKRFTEKIAQLICKNYFTYGR